MKTDALENKILGEYGREILSFDMVVTRAAKGLEKCCVSRRQRYQFRLELSYVNIDYKRGYAVASNGVCLKASKVEISGVQGEAAYSILIDPKDFKELSGLCHVKGLEDGRVIVTCDKTGSTYLANSRWPGHTDDFRKRYPNWASAVPVVSSTRANYLKAGRVKEIITFIKDMKKRDCTQVFCIEGIKKRNVVKFSYYDYGVHVVMEMPVEGTLPFDFSIKVCLAEFLALTTDWDGGMFVENNFGKLSLTDKYRNTCFTMLVAPDENERDGYTFSRSKMVQLTDYNNL